LSKSRVAPERPEPHRLGFGIYMRTSEERLIIKAISITYEEYSIYLKKDYWYLEEAAYFIAGLKKSSWFSSKSKARY